MCRTLPRDAGQQQGARASSQPRDHQGKYLRLYSVLYTGNVLRTRCFVLSHPVMSTKHPSGSPASGEKRKATTLEMKRQITAQLEATVSVLSVFKEG